MIEIKDRVLRIMEQDDLSEINKIAALVELHEIQKGLDGISKDIAAWKRENLSDFEMIAQEYPDGYGGYTFEFRNGGKTFVYDQIPEIVSSKMALKSLEEKYKAAYASIQKGITPIDSETGEVLQSPTVKYRASSVILKAIRRRIRL